MFTLSGGTTNITNSTVTANHTFPFAGGGLQNNDGVTNVTNSTIYDNSSDASGGGGIENRNLARSTSATAPLPTTTPPLRIADTRARALRTSELGP